MKRIKAALKKTSRTTLALTSALLIVLLVISIFSVKYWSREEAGTIMAEDIQRLAEIFERISVECTILSFDYPKNPINFLTIKAGGFVGSEVGSMNLKHPEKWQGPYVQETPTMQGKAYQIISTAQGYFIVPGDGVKLPNGKVVGKDIVLDGNTNIYALMNDSQGLMFEGQPLASPLIASDRTFHDQAVSEEFV